MSCIVCFLDIPWNGAHTAPLAQLCMRGLEYSRPGVIRNGDNNTIACCLSAYQSAAHPHLHFQSRFLGSEISPVALGAKALALRRVP